MVERYPRGLLVLNLAIDRVEDSMVHVVLLQLPRNVSLKWDGAVFDGTLRLGSENLPA